MPPKAFEDDPELDAWHFAALATRRTVAEAQAALSRAELYRWLAFLRAHPELLSRLF